ncbi:MAG: hypothetical protein AA931_07990 [Peptococcaceae bacterium 1109]|nr:MAG: hypothetical protein AA931_07990 [Peptococcaceae bacterium 1109]
MASKRYVLEIDGLSKRYGRVEALDDVSLQLPMGEIWGVLGPNGSGKSTLLKCIAGLVKPDEGSIRINGLSPSRATKSVVAFVPEINTMYRWMTVAEVMSFAAAFYQDWSKERAQELMEFMRLEPGKKVGSLSKGMRARLRLILGMARDAQLVLLDEPLSGIDPASRDRIVEGIARQFDGEGRSIVLSTHAVDETERLFDTVMFLRDGHIELIGNAEELRIQRGKSINDLFKEVYA